MKAVLKASGYGYKEYVELEIDVSKFKSWKDMEFEIRHLGLRPDKAKYEVVFRTESEEEVDALLTETVYKKTD